jgi:hypothetical protein
MTKIKMKPRGKKLTPKVAELRIDQLKPHPRNYRQHPEDQLKHIAHSITEHGFYRHVVVSQDGYILAGHGVVEAARRIGMTTVPALVVGCLHNSTQAMKILTGDNELTRFAEVDDRALSELLKNINDTDGLLGTGYDESILANLVMVTRPESEIKDLNAAAHWVGMPEFEPVPDAHRIVVSFQNEEDRNKFLKLINASVVQKRTGLTWSIWWPEKENEDLASLRFTTGKEQTKTKRSKR